MFRVVRKESPNIHGLDENQLEKLNFINLVRYLICRAAIVPRTTKIVSLELVTEPVLRKKPLGAHLHPYKQVSLIHPL